MGIKHRKDSGKEKGTSSLEYMILTAAVVSIMIVFMGHSGAFSKSLTATYTQTADGMTVMAERFSKSYSQSLTPSSSTSEEGSGSGGFD